MKKNLKNKVFKYVMLQMLIFTFISCTKFSLHEVKAGLIYEHNYPQNIVTKGVTYEKKTRITDKGLVNIHIITADISNKNIKVGPIQSNTYGSRSTTSALVNNNGALAGINADYFDMSMTPVTSMGMVVDESKIVSLSEGEKGYASFLIDSDNNPFIDYVYPKISFTNNGQENIRVRAMNKYQRNFSAVYFDRQAITSTKDLDAKFPDLVKFVVKDGVIDYISKGGETVEVPENGYIILVAATYAQYFYDSVKVGDKADIHINTSFDFSAIKTAIGGAGKILENGKYVNSGYVVSPGKRQPRSAVGISKDGKKIYLVAIDGRGISIGVTHEEFANILADLGAYNAMQLDGGGSTTMAVKTINDDSVKVVNKVSEGSQRKVANALGVFNTAEPGNVTSLDINTYPRDIVFLGSDVDVYAFGLDDQLNKIDVSNNIKYSSDDKNGVWNGYNFKPSKTGEININVDYNGITESKKIECLDLAEIKSEDKLIELPMYGTKTLNFKGISTTGKTENINTLTYEVVPKELGTIENSVFKVTGSGSGYIKASVGDISTYIEVHVGSLEKPITSFNGDDIVSFENTQNGVSGNVSYDSDKNSEGNNALKLTYSFDISETTQAAYATFKNPFVFGNNAIGFKIALYGDNSNNWARARLIDANGGEFLVDISRNIDWTGWKNLIVPLPEKAVKPLKLDKLYIASLSNESKLDSSIYFDDLIGLYPIEYKHVDLPEANKYKNPLFDISSFSKENGVDITFVGTTNKPGDKLPDNINDIENSWISKFKNNSSVGVFVGDTYLDGIENLNTKKISKGYKYQEFNNISLISLNASKGSLTKTSVYNWSFYKEIKNSNVQNVVFIINKNIDNISDKNIFKEALKDLVDMGKTIFVVSADDNISVSNYMEDGVTYINLDSLFNSSGSINKDFSILRLRVNSNNIKFNIEKVF